MHHDGIKQLLPELRKGTLPEGSRSEVEAHIERCEDCRKELELLTMLDSIEVPDPGARYWDGLARTVRVAAEVEKTRRGMKASGALPGAAWAPGAWLAKMVPAAMAIGVIIGIALMFRHGGNDMRASGQGIAVRTNVPANPAGYTDPLAAPDTDYGLISASDIPSPLKDVRIDRVYLASAYAADSYYAELRDMDAGELESLNAILKNEEKKEVKRI